MAELLSNVRALKKNTTPTRNSLFFLVFAVALTVFTVNLLVILLEEESDKKPEKRYIDCSGEHSSALVPGTVAEVKSVGHNHHSGEKLQKRISIRRMMAKAQAQHREHANDGAWKKTWKIWAEVRYLPHQIVVPGVAVRK